MPGVMSAAKERHSAGTPNTKEDLAAKERKEHKRKKLGIIQTVLLDSIK